MKNMLITLEDGESRFEKIIIIETKDNSAFGYYAIRKKHQAIDFNKENWVQNKKIIPHQAKTIIQYLLHV